MEQPSLFISHGAPSFALEDGPARDFLIKLGPALDQPDAIIVASAHHMGRDPLVTSDAKPETIYDFRGFPDELYQMTYPAPGAPALANSIVASLTADGFSARTQADRGFDHGTWIPLKLMFPAANIPVIQISISLSQGPMWHYRLGQSLARFRKDNILIIGSGALTHGLPDFFGQGRQASEHPPHWVTQFSDWMQTNLEAGNLDAVLEVVERAPFGKRNHPSLDHLLPLYVAMGAGGAAKANALHRSVTYGVLAMDVYGFGEADTLKPFSDQNLSQVPHAFSQV